jgi:hypothetical protein
MYGLEFGVMPMGDKIGMLLPTKVHWAVMYVQRSRALPSVYLCNIFACT